MNVDIPGDLSILVDIAKVLKELDEDLLFGHFSLLNLRMHTNIIDSLEICRGDGAIAIFVELEESLVDHGLPPGRGLASDGH